jgi:hypothetical protein
MYRKGRERRRPLCHLSHDRGTRVSGAQEARTWPQWGQPPSGPKLETLTEPAESGWGGGVPERRSA